MNEKMQQVRISIDLKKYRIRIHKNTLAALGMPKHIQLLVNPLRKTIAIQGLQTQTKFSHRVTLNQINPESYEIYSCSFIDELLNMVENLDKDCTYRLIGEVIKGKNTVAFPLDSIKQVNNMEEQRWN